MAARFLLIGVAFGALAVMPVFITGPSGTTVDLTGVLIAVAAFVVLSACVVSLRRDLRRGRSL